MQFRYKVSEEEIMQVFGGLFDCELEHDWDEDQQETTINEFITLTRGRQSYSDIIQVKPRTLQHCMILLDYLSYDKSSWDYEPRLEIHFGGGVLTYNRRGNYGHYGALDEGDYLIICSEIKKALDNGAIRNALGTVTINYQEQVNGLVNAVNAMHAQVKTLSRQLQVYKDRDEMVAAKRATAIANKGKRKRRKKTVTITKQEQS